MRVAIYARMSSELQRETSITDQISVASRYAHEHGWQVLHDHIYKDVAISGASIEGRSGLQTLIEASTLTPRPFDVILVDDSSRISRDLADALRTMQLLKFRGVRVIYVSQGIDSARKRNPARIVKMRPNAATLSAIHWPLPVLTVADTWRSSRSNMPCATSVPRKPPTIWAMT